MEAIEFVKITHKPFIGDIDNSVFDEYGHNYEYYFNEYVSDIDKLCKINNCPEFELKNLRYITIDEHINTIPDFIDYDRMLIKNRETLPLMKIDKMFYMIGFQHCKFSIFPDIPSFMLLFDDCDLPNIPENNRSYRISLYNCRVNNISNKLSIDALCIHKCKDIVIPELARINYLEVVNCRKDIIPKHLFLKLLYVDGDIDIPETLLNLSELTIVNSNITNIPDTFTSLKKISFRKTNLKSLSDKFINVETLEFIDCEIPFIPNYPNLKKIIVHNSVLKQHIPNSVIVEISND